MWRLNGIKRILPCAVSGWGGSLLSGSLLSLDAIGVGGGSGTLPIVGVCGARARADERGYELLTRASLLRAPSWYRKEPAVAPVGGLDLLKRLSLGSSREVN